MCRLSTKETTQQDKLHLNISVACSRCRLWASQGWPSLRHGALNLVRSRGESKASLDEFFKLIWWLHCWSLWAAGRGTHSGLWLVGRKKINLGAPKTELLMQKGMRQWSLVRSLWGHGFRLQQDPGLLQTSAGMQESSHINRKAVYWHWPRVWWAFWSGKRKNKLKLGIYLWTGKINRTEMLSPPLARGLYLLGKHGVPAAINHCFDEGCRKSAHVYPSFQRLLSIWR